MNSRNITAALTIRRTGMNTIKVYLSKNKTTNRTHSGRLYPVNKNEKSCYAVGPAKILGSGSDVSGRFFELLLFLQMFPGEVRKNTETVYGKLNPIRENGFPNPFIVTIFGAGLKVALRISYTLLCPLNN